MKCYQTYIINREIHPAEYLVQLYSIVRHKDLNPSIPIVLLTDSKSLKIFEKNGLTKFYDEVRTDIFENYPYDRISSTFTSFPKIWAISKLETPFVIQDIDLIYHRSMDELEFFHFGYLFKHISNSYPRPYELSTPDGFEWSKLNYFKTVLPVDTSFLYFNNEIFKKQFTDFYFKFVLDNPGEYVNVDNKLLEKNIIPRLTQKSKSYLVDNGIDKFSNQFILSVIAEEQQNINQDFRIAQIVPVLFDSEKFISLNNSETNPIELINNTAYYLGGSKYCLNGITSGCNTQATIKYIIKSGEELLNNSLDGWEIYGNTYALLINKINQTDIS